MLTDSSTKIGDIELPARYARILGSKEYYGAFAKLLNDYLAEGLKTRDEIKSIVSRLDGRYNQMNAEYWNSWLKRRVVKRHREELRKDDVIGPFITTLEEQLRTANIKAPKKIPKEG